MINCKYFDEGCSAPLCPLDLESLNCGRWYPDEEICKNREFTNPTWIKNQKKIAKRARDKEKYFTIEMLNRNCAIAKGIVGLDPDRAEEPQLKEWLKKHPELSEKEKERRKIFQESGKEKRFKKHVKKEKISTHVP
jgi:hypothetical protein